MICFYRDNADGKCAGFWVEEQPKKKLIDYMFARDAVRYLEH